MSRVRLLLCTDLDRTLIPNGAQPESPGARQRFAALVAHDDILLAYVSGRDRTLVEEAIHEYALPSPDFVIGDVGTTIYDLREGEWHDWAAWESEIDPDWNGYSHEQLHALHSDLPELTLQEAAKQNRHKVSYYVALTADLKSLLDAMQQRLHAHAINASLIWSIDEAAGVGLLDVLPQRATKLHAVEFLQERLGLPRESTLFAGDSGNDLPVLASAIPSVLVANAMPEVAADALASAAAAGHSAALYLAHGGLLGMNGNYSAGILEGVAHFHPQLVACFSGPLMEVT